MHQGPPQTNGYLPTVVIGIVWVFPCCGFITLDLLCLNYKSQLKLESSCHCPDMWLVGVIVFFISLIPHTPLSALPKASLSKGSFLPHFHTATATPKPPVLFFQVSPVGYITTPFPVAERRLRHLLQPLFSRLPTREQLQPSFSKVPRQTIKLL